MQNDSPECFVLAHPSQISELEWQIQTSPLLLDYTDYKTIETIQLAMKGYNISVDDKRHREKPEFTLDALETCYHIRGIGRLLFSASTSTRRFTATSAPTRFKNQYNNTGAYHCIRGQQDY